MVFFFSVLSDNSWNCIKTLFITYKKILFSFEIMYQAWSLFKTILFTLCNKMFSILGEQTIVTQFVSHEIPYGLTFSLTHLTLKSQVS